jgi:serine phosphatase RsbU (regulator of sigma subunit)
VIGVITVQSYKTNAYSEYHLNILRSLATTIATALDNAMLYENLEEKVRERTQELSQQKEIIEEKNKHITDSIRYAKRIQDATLPSIGLVRSMLPDSFVLFKPKDIVSGDFYWVETVDDTVLFAVVDCTGHGVPGAFLSLIGHNSLNQIVNELQIIKPADILFELDKIVYNTLQNNLEETNIKDGMDMSICSLNLNTRELEFAGAYNPLYLLRNNELTEVKGDKIAIGSGQMNQKYTNTELQLEEGDRIYLFSDGYADQFGGPKGKKFKYSQFKELLVQIHQKPMEQQHKLLNHSIDAWQGDLEQIDDVCIIGVQV